MVTEVSRARDGKARKEIAAKKKEHNELLDAYKVIFNMDVGRVVLNDLMRMTSQLTPIDEQVHDKFNTGYSDRSVFQRMGARNVGLYILSMLKYDINDFTYDVAEVDDGRDS